MTDPVHDCPGCECEPPLPRIEGYKMDKKFGTWTGFNVYGDKDGDVWIVDEDDNPIGGGPDFISTRELREIAEASGVIDDE